MLKLIFVLLAACSAIHGEVCETYGGKEFYTFSGTKEAVKIPCKYNAVRDTRCGPYRVTITPGNDFDEDSRRYVPADLWIRVEDIYTGKRFEGRTNYDISNKWLKNYGKSVPIMKRDGELDFYDVFAIPESTTANYLIVPALDHSFEIGFYLYDPRIKRSYKDSGFAFVCDSHDFEPTSYPDQLCGNGTVNEVKNHKNQMGYDSLDATLLLNVLKNDGIEQGDKNCRLASKTIAKKCDGREYEAVSTCGPIFTDSSTTKCVVKGGADIRSAFRHCVEYVCRGKSAKKACVALKKELKKCTKLKKSVLSNPC